MDTTSILHILFFSFKNNHFAIHSPKKRDIQTFFFVTDGGRATQEGIFSQVSQMNNKNHFDLSLTQLCDKADWFMLFVHHQSNLEVCEEYMNCLQLHSSCYMFEWELLHCCYSVTSWWHNRAVRRQAVECTALSKVFNEAALLNCRVEVVAVLLILQFTTLGGNCTGGQEFENCDITTGDTTYCLK